MEVTFKKSINRESATNDFNTSYEIPSKVDASVFKHPVVHSGSGFAAAKLQDSGFEPTFGATYCEGVPKRARKMIEVGESLAVPRVSAARVFAERVSNGSKPKHAPEKNRQAPVPEATLPESVPAGTKP